MAQHKATFRNSMRSALSHKKLADDMLDNILTLQTRMASMMSSLDDDAGTVGGSLAGTYTATYPSTFTLSIDTPGEEAQHKATPRISLRSALRNKGLADDLLDSMDELDASMDVVMTQLTADDGAAPTGAAYATASVTEDDAEASAGDAPYTASRRRTLKSALAHSSLADTVVDAVTEMQNQWNQMITILDGGATANTLSITPIEPDAER